MNQQTNPEHHDQERQSKALQNVTGNLRVVSLCTIVSRVLGLLRDQAMSSLFGAGPILDAFTVAFRLPNLARVLLGEGALTTAFLPVFVKELNEHGRTGAARTTWAVFLVLACVLSAAVLVIELALWLIGFAWTLGPDAERLRILTALLMPYVVLICLAAQLSAVLNGIGRFLWPALIPIVLNVAWLGALWWLVPRWSDVETQVQLTAVVVLVAGGLQLLFPLPTLIRNGLGFRSDWRQSLDRVGSITRNMLPVVVGLSVTQMNVVLDSFVAWGFTQPSSGEVVMPLPGSPLYPLTQGTATALYLGQRLYQFPVGVFGVALGTVLFPLLALHAQRGELHRLREDLSLGIRLVLAICIPASAGLMLLAHPLSTMLFQYGRFDAEDARLTGDMIACYGSGVWAYCGLLILQRGFYAVGDRITPMRIGLWTMLLNIVLNLTLIWPMGGRGLALSTAAVAAAQCLVTGWLLQLRVGEMNWREIGMTLLKTTMATMVMSITCLVLMGWATNSSDLSGRGLRLALPLVGGIGSFFATAALIGLHEPMMLLRIRHSSKTEESRSTDGEA